MTSPKLHIAAAIVVDHLQRVYLQLRDDKPTIKNPGHWCIFGGRIEAGETPVQGIKRELFEELAIDADESEFHLFRVFDRPDRTFHIFVVDVGLRGESARLGEGQAFERFSRDQLQVIANASKIGERPVIPWVSEALRLYLLE